jgi:hypothetical protein
LHLAKLLRLGEIVTVVILGETQEAARDRVRAREDARLDLMSARHRLGKLLLRRGITYPGSYLGLVPMENSSGQSRSQGGLTRTGNAYAGRLRGSRQRAD